MDPFNLWPAILAEIELKVSRPTFTAFFLKTKLDSLQDNRAVISVANPLVKDIVESRYYSLIKGLLEKHSQKKINLQFKIGAVLKEEGPPGPLFVRAPAPFSSQNQIEFSHLNPLYSFDNFAVSSSNQMAYAAARAITHSPGRAYNPLFLYGGVGVGKTHLMQAIGIQLLKKDASVKVIFCTGEEFTNEIINAIRSKTTHKFKDKFRTASVFLIDDVQFIAGKNAVQEEFFYTFSAIYRRGGQIVLTSDKPPSAISKLEERLRSRFEGGLLIDIQPPDFELRSAILLIKAKLRGIDLPMNIAQELAVQVSDARRLEGALIRFLTEAEVLKEPISLSLAHRLFGKKLAPGTNTPSLSSSSFINAVSKYFNIRVSLLKGERRLKQIVFPRQVLMFLLRSELLLSLNEIGALLGGRDHSTVLHGIEKVTSLVSKNESVQKDIFAIKSLVGEK